MPELNTSMPLTPSVPAFADRIVTTPLDVAVPSPVPMLTDPPVFTALRPAYACTHPPAPLVRVGPQASAPASCSSMALLQDARFKHVSGPARTTFCALRVDVYMLSTLIKLWIRPWFRLFCV